MPDMTKIRFILLAALVTASATFGARGDAPRCPRVVERNLAVVDTFVVAESSGTDPSRYVYLGNRNVLEVIDLTDPKVPTEIGAAEFPGYSYLRPVLTHDHYLYVSADSDLLVLDVHVPGEPYLLAIHPNRAWSGDTERFGRFVYKIRGTYQDDSRIQVLDLVDPRDPVEVASIPGDFRALAISGTLLFALTWDYPAHPWSLRAFVLNEPQTPWEPWAPWAPWEIGSYRHTRTGRASDVVASGMTAFVATASGPVAVDFSNPVEPVALSVPDNALSGTWSPLGIHGDYLYGFVFSDMQFRMVVSDVRNPSNPVPVGDCEIPFASFFVASQLTFTGDHALVALRESGLVVIDVSLPTDPYIIANLSEGWRDDVAASGNYGYWLVRQPTEHTFASTVSLRVADVSEPRGTIDVGQLDLHDATWLTNAQSDLAVAGSNAYVVDDTGFRIIDVARPSSPRQIAHLDIPATGIAVSGSHAYVGGSPGTGLSVLDISDPERPLRVASLHSVAVSGEAIEAAGGNLYVASAGPGGFRIFDISDPASPLEMGSLDLPRWGSVSMASIAIDGSHAYLAIGEAGLMIIDISDPSTPRETVSVSPSTWNPYSDHEVAETIEIANHLLYVGGQFSLVVFDVTDPSEPRLVETRSDIQPHDIAVRDSLAFIAEGVYGSTTLTLDCNEIMHPDAPRWP